MGKKYKHMAHKKKSKLQLNTKILMTLIDFFKRKILNNYIYFTQIIKFL